MRNTAFLPCIPTPAKKVPDRPHWFHEIKLDGYRMIVQRDRDDVRLFTRNGHDWTDRYPWVVEAARKIRSKQFVLDGEAVVLGVDNRPDFDSLHSRKHNDEVQLCAFDILALDGEDLRTSEPCRFICAITSFPACWRVAFRAYSFRPLRSARSARSCLALPATWGWRA